MDCLQLHPIKLMRSCSPAHEEDVSLEEAALVTWEGESYFLASCQIPAFMWIMTGSGFGIYFLSLCSFILSILKLRYYYIPFGHLMLLTRSSITCYVECSSYLKWFYNLSLFCDLLWLLALKIWVGKEILFSFGNCEIST